MDGTRTQQDLVIIRESKRSARVEGSGSEVNLAEPRRPSTARSIPEGALIDSSANPREAFVVACAEAIAAGTRTGDVGLARVAHAAVGELLEDGGGGDVADLGEARRRRDGEP